MEVERIDHWEPDYTRKCECCNGVPVVTGYRDGVRVYRGLMCGVCTWGDSDMADPDEWNQ